MRIAFVFTILVMVLAGCQQVSPLKRLEVVAHALENYKVAKGRFPSSANEINGQNHSWRVLLAPFIESNCLHDNYDFSLAWDEGSNRELLFREDLSCLGFRRFLCDMSSEGLTAKVSIVLRSELRQAPRISEEIPDFTCLVLEWRATQFHWMEPKDVDLQDIFSNEFYSTDNVEGAAVLLANHEVVLMKTSDAQKLARSLATMLLRQQVGDNANVEE